MKERIRSTHVHDNDGKNDSHLFPLVTEGGTIDWKKAMELLRSGEDQYPLVLELRSAADNAAPAGHGVPGFRPAGSAIERSEDRNDSTQTNYVRSLLKRSPGETVTARGWVKTRRDSKNVHFIQLNDGSSPVDLQVVLDAGVVSEEEVANDHHRRLHQRGRRTGGVDGQGPVRGVEGEAVTMHGTADPEHYPLQKKKHTLETLREIGPPADAVEHVRRGLPRAQRAGRGDPQVLPGPRLPVCAHAGDLGVGCGRRGQHVPR